jgi:hypothetical protein
MKVLGPCQDAQKSGQNSDLKEAFHAGATTRIVFSSQEKSNAVSYKYLTELVFTQTAVKPSNSQLKSAEQKGTNPPQEDQARKETTAPGA